MEAAVEELSRGLSLASAREGASKDGGDASATGGNPGGMMKSAAAQRVEELERRKDAKKFDGMASSLFDALDAVPVRPKSLLEDSKDSTGATSSISRKDFGRGLSVIDQFALRVHSSHASSEATFNLDGTARTKATSGSLASTAGDTGLGSGLALSSKKKKQPNLSRKARQRKEKSRQRGQAYSERASGPSKRGRARGKSSRLQLI